MSLEAVYVYDKRRTAGIVAVVCLLLIALLVVALAAFNALSTVTDFLYPISFLGIFGVSGAVSHFRGYRYEFYDSFVTILRRGREPVTILYSRIWLGNLVYSRNGSIFKIAKKPEYTDPSLPGPGTSQTYTVLNAPLAKLNKMPLYDWVRSKAAESSIDPPSTQRPTEVPGQSSLGVQSVTGTVTQPKVVLDYGFYAYYAFTAALLVAIVGPAYFWFTAGFSLLNTELGLVSVTVGIMLTAYGFSLRRLDKVYAAAESLQPGSGVKAVRNNVRLIGMLYLVFGAVIVLATVGIALAG